MFETLITHYQSPLYFGVHMADDLGIPFDLFQKIWHSTEHERSVGMLTLEDVLKKILLEHNCYSDTTMNTIVNKRISAKEECFNHIHSDIIPLLTILKNNGYHIGLISNCFSEEAYVIRKSNLITYFYAIYLSYKQGIEKPDNEIYNRCMEELSVKPEECVYVGDGGSNELEAARSLGMNAVQATWYIQDGLEQLSKRKHDFLQLDKPFDLIHYIN